MVIAARIAQPWRGSPTMRPKTRHSAAGSSSIEIIRAKFVAGVGFSKGCAEFALKNPPPFVPSILIASCEATGPMARVCVRVVTACVIGLPLASLTAAPLASSCGSS